MWYNKRLIVTTDITIHFPLYWDRLFRKDINTYGREI